MESEMAETDETETVKCPICYENNPEWIAYGSCGHREICSTCVARFRFIARKFDCYYCRTRLDFVFVTKASGILTERIKDFPKLPPKPKEGQIGEIWYHSGTKAFFDDYEEYQRIKTMCRISCSLCGEAKFMCVGELMSHLLEKHKLYMCLICLVWRNQLFVWEQKLFTTEQLNQHIRTGDSEVDGTYKERGGFKGHPHCTSCRNPFYGDDEIYVHLSTSSIFHCSITASCDCHICRRLHPILTRTEGPLLTHTQSEVQGHFVQHHIQEEDGYWNANFPIIRAFFDEKTLLEHYENGHHQRWLENRVQNQDESFRREPVYAYTHSPTVPPVYCPPPPQHAQTSSDLPPLPALLQIYREQIQPYSNQYRGHAQQQPYGGQRQYSNQNRGQAQQQPYGGQRQYSNQNRGHAQGRVEMARTHLGLGHAASSSLNTTTQSPLAQSRFLSSSFHPLFVQQSGTRQNSDMSYSSRAHLGQSQVPSSSSYHPFSVQQLYQDQSRTRQNSDMSSSSRVYLGQPQEARFGMSGTHQSYSAPEISDTRTRQNSDMSSSARAYLGQPQEARFGMSGTHESYSAPDTRSSFSDYVKGRGFPVLESEMACPSSNPPPFSGQQPYQGHSSTQSSVCAPLAHGRSYSESYGLSGSAPRLCTDSERQQELVDTHNARLYSSQAQSSDPSPLFVQQPNRDHSSAQSSDRAPLPPTRQDFLQHLGSYGLSDFAPRFWNDSEIQHELMDTSNAILNTSQAHVMVEPIIDDSQEDQENY